MEQESKGIRYQSENCKAVQNLMYLVNEESLKEEHRRQKGKKATGTDGVTKESYGQQLEENIEELVNRMKKFSYKPQAVRRTYIPKTNGKVRPLGIPAYEDKLVQGVMSKILNEVYEVRFLDSSYGFRPGRNAHQVVRYINQTVMTKKVNYVLEADIKGFFDNVNHEWLMKFLGNDIEDKNFLRYIKRFLIAGVMEGTEYHASDKGTPQGGLISPILANVYLHYVLDWWFEENIRGKLKGEAYYVRYADDFLIFFQYESEAIQVIEKLRRRLKAFSLELAEEKTRILPIGRYKGTKEEFDFLGFTFFNAKTREGKYRLSIRTCKKKLMAKKQGVKAWLQTKLTSPVAETMRSIASIVRGHCNYYGVNGNFMAIQKYWKYIKYSCYRMLNRRDQKGRLKYSKYLRIWNFYVPKPHLTVNIWQWQPKTI